VGLVGPFQSQAVLAMPGTVVLSPCQEVTAQLQVVLAAVSAFQAALAETAVLWQLMLAMAVRQVLVGTSH
jgi:hypothetical protein